MRRQRSFRSEDPFYEDTPRRYGGDSRYPPDYDELGGDYEDLRRLPREPGPGWPGQYRVPRRDWREWGEEYAAPPEELGGWASGRPGGTFRGYEGGGWAERPARRTRRERHGHPVPADYRRYLSREEYGLAPEFENDPGPWAEERLGPEAPFPGRRADYAGSGRPGGPPARRGARGGRFPSGAHRPNALFGGAGLRRYDQDYDEQWW